MNQTNDTLELVKSAQGKANAALADDVLNKAITQATGLVAYDLEAPAKRMIPVLTPLRNEIPRVKGNGGTATNWKAVTAINAGKTGIGVSEGNRGGNIATSVVPYVAAYAGIGLEDSVTYEAEYASEGFQDVKATAALGLLDSLMIGEELMLYGANNSLPLGVTPTPALSTATGQAAGAIGTGVVASVICVALSHEGFQRATVSATGVMGLITKTNTDGTTDAFGGGSAQKSAAASVTTGAGSANTVSASVAPVVGAVAYAWYIGTAGNEMLAAITSVNSVVINALPSGNQLASALAAADYSQNQMLCDGLLTYALKPGSNAYVATMPTGTLGKGTPLTSDGAGGIKEFTAAFSYFWAKYRLSPDKVWVSAQELISISTLIVANGGAPLIRFTQGTDQAHINIAAGVVVGTILNPITQTMVKIVVHPNAVPGTALFTTSRLPYKLNDVANVMQVKTRREYYQLEWPLRSRRYEYGVYADELLQHYAPFSLGVISNIGTL